MKKKRSLPPHIVLPDGRWRFIKKGKVAGKQIKARGKSMAKRKSYRKYFSKGGIKAGLGGILPPVAGGAGDVIARKFIPVNGVGSILAGMFLKDTVTTKIGFNKAGESLGAMFFGNGGSKNGGWL